MSATLTAEPRPAAAGLGRGWVIGAVLAALLVVAHIGCHGDEDNELTVAPPVQDTSANE